MQSIPHDQWPAFLFALLSRFKGAPTKVRMGDRHPEGHKQDLAHDLPLASLELDLRPKQAIRVELTQPSGAPETVVVEHPEALSLIEADDPEAVIGEVGIRIESASSTYFVHFGLPTH